MLAITLLPSTLSACYDPHSTAWRILYSWMLIGLPSSSKVSHRYAALLCASNESKWTRVWAPLSGLAGVMNVYGSVAIVGEISSQPNAIQMSSVADVTLSRRPKDSFVYTMAPCTAQQYCSPTGLFPGFPLPSLPPLIQPFP